MSKFAAYSVDQINAAINNPAISEGLKASLVKELASRKKKGGTQVDELSLLVGDPVGTPVATKVVERKKVSSKDLIAREIKLGQEGGALYSFGCKALYRPVDEYGVALSAEASIEYLAARGYQGKAVEALCRNPGWKVHKSHAQYQG